MLLSAQNNEPDRITQSIDLCLPAFFKFIDRHTLDLIDAELLQVRNFLNDPKVSSFVGHF